MDTMNGRLAKRGEQAGREGQCGASICSVENFFHRPWMMDRYHVRGVRGSRGIIMEKLT
jgi:hypothetical protein